jgi:hypothetical protein
VIRVDGRQFVELDDDRAGAVSRQVLGAEPAIGGRVRFSAAGR